MKINRATKSLSLFASKYWKVPLVLAMFFLGCSCKDSQTPRVAANQSKLMQATDVFWALYNLGYAISKEKPNPSQHGCKPFEYLAKKEKALFRISVFECGDFDQAKALVENSYTQKVDSLLRNHGEGGILQRGPLQIIIRMTEGDKKSAEELLETLGNL